MKTIIRNFLSVIRRFKMATLLNILGLSVAFTAVIVIMMQVTFDLGFNTNQPEADNIYRIDIEFTGREFAVLPRPFIDDFKASTPYIKAAGYSASMMSDMFDWLFKVENAGDVHYHAGKMMLISPGYTDVFQFKLTEGTLSQINEPQTVFIPESMAKRIFGDASAIHQYLTDDKNKMIIGGVYKDFPENCSTKNVIYSKIPDEMDKGNWGNFAYEGYVLVDPSTDIDEILEGFTKTLDPKLFDESGLSDVTFKAVSLKQIHFDTNTEFDTVQKVGLQTIWALIAIAFVIMLIAAINFTNYSIALTPLRIKSVNTQKVLGASEKRLRSSLVIEAVFTCFLAWTISILFTYLLSTTSISQIISSDMSLSQHWGLIIGVAGVALAVGLFAGIYPAYYITSFAPALVLKGSFGLSPKGRQLRNSLVGIQFVASFALIVVALFMYLQIDFMQNVSLGFDKDQLIVTELNEPVIKAREVFANEIKSNPNIETLSYAETLLSGFDSYSTWSQKFKDEKKQFQVLTVDTGFLRTMGIHLLDGRDYSTSDTQREGGDLFIFNEKARGEFGLVIGDKSEEGGEVIGFIPNITITSMRKELEPMAFRCVYPDQVNGRRWSYIRVKAGSNLKDVISHIESTLDKISPGYPFNVRIYDNILNNLYMKENNLTTLITWFSLIAVLISIVGVFGLVVFESEYKRKEIGVRKVLGSTTIQILAMFNIRYVRILAVCFVLAAPIAWYVVSRWFENFAYRTPMYWWVFLFSFLLITTITIATVTFQSWRVADANPVDSIKTE